MVRSYIRVLPDLYARKRLGRKPHGKPYTADQFTAFVGVLCAAEAVTPRGRFQSKQMLVGMLAGDLLNTATIEDSVQFLIKQGDLVKNPDGTLYVEGWDELQEGRDPSVNVRMARYRDRQRKPRRGNGRVTRNRTVTVPLSAVGRKAEGNTNKTSRENYEEKSSALERGVSTTKKISNGQPTHIGETLAGMQLRKS